MQIKPISLLILTFSVLFFSQCAKENAEYTYNKGQVFGTYYSITYLHPKRTDLQLQIEEKFKEFDNSLSTFNPRSIISRINANSPVIIDDFFEEMYTMAQEVSDKSHGAFDITVAPLVNAWGFGFGNHDHTSSPNPDTIMPYIGYKKIRLENQRLIKENPRIMLDASAIAKGQSCDVIAALLEENGCKNYMVEVGGEIMCKGLNPKGEKWHIGIDKLSQDLNHPAHLWHHRSFTFLQLIQLLVIADQLLVLRGNQLTNLLVIAFQRFGFR